MLPLTPKSRNALKYLAVFDQSLYHSLHSKSSTTSTLSRPAITKKKYSELPALHAQLERPPDAVLDSQIISNTHNTRRTHAPKCVPFSTYERLRRSANGLMSSRDFERVFDYDSPGVTIRFTL